VQVDTDADAVALDEAASRLLQSICIRSSEGRKRVIAEVVATLAAASSAGAAGGGQQQGEALALALQEPPGSKRPDVAYRPAPGAPPPLKVGTLLLPLPAPSRTHRHAHAHTPSPTPLGKSQVRAFVELVGGLVTAQQASLTADGRGAAQPPAGGLSSETVRAMREAGMVKALAMALRQVDLAHPGAAKAINAVLKPLEVRCCCCCCWAAAAPLPSCLLGRQPEACRGRLGSVHWVWCLGRAADVACWVPPLQVLTRSVAAWTTRPAAAAAAAEAVAATPAPAAASAPRAQPVAAAETPAEGGAAAGPDAQAAAHRMMRASQGQGQVVDLGQMGEQQLLDAAQMMDMMGSGVCGGLVVVVVVGWAAAACVWGLCAHTQAPHSPRLAPGRLAAEASAAASAQQPATPALRLRRAAAPQPCSAPPAPIHGARPPPGSRLPASAAASQLPPCCCPPAGEEEDEDLDGMDHDMDDDDDEVEDEDEDDEEDDEEGAAGDGPSDEHGAPGGRGRGGGGLKEGGS
jgi:hypothetical protein